jgi:FkbM family methyltransferase
MKVFIDCGSHCGESILEAKRRWGNDIKIYSFEANPNLATKLKKAFEFDKNVIVENKAVWIENSFIKFYLSTLWSDGSSVYVEKTSGGIKEDFFVNVESIDLIEFIKNSFNEDDYIILKLDIEGAEYEVLNKLIESKCINKINEIHGEFHDNIENEHVKKLENKIFSYFNDNNIIFYCWEMGMGQQVIDRSIWKNCLNTLYSEDLKKTNRVWLDKASQDQLSLNEWLIPNLRKEDKILFVGTGNSSLAKECADAVNCIDGITVIHSEFNFAKDLNLKNYNVYLFDKYGNDILTLNKKYSYIADVNLTSYARNEFDFLNMINNYFSLLENNGKILSTLVGLGYIYEGCNCNITSIDKLISSLNNNIKIPFEIKMETDLIFSISKK